MIPGRPAHHWRGHENDQTAADWLLSLLDATNEHHVLIAMPHAGSDAQLDALKDDFWRAYDLAQDERPHFAQKLLHRVDVGIRTHDSHVIVVLQEHRWVGGHCINGCNDTRDPAA